MNCPVGMWNALFGLGKNVLGMVPAMIVMIKGQRRKGSNEEGRYSKGEKEQLFLHLSIFLVVDRGAAKGRAHLIFPQICTRDEENE